MCVQNRRFLKEAETISPNGRALMVKIMIGTVMLKKIRKCHIGSPCWATELGPF